MSMKNPTDKEKEWFIDYKKEWNNFISEEVLTRRKLICDRWLEIKRCFDLIYKKLSPLDSGEQTVTIKKYELEQNNIDENKTFFRLMDRLEKIGIVSITWHKMDAGRNPDGTPPNRIRGMVLDMFLGEKSVINITNLELFETQHKLVSELCSKMEESWKQQFSTKFLEKDNEGGEEKRFPEKYLQPNAPPKKTMAVLSVPDTEKTDRLQKNNLESIHLVTESLEPKEVIFLVLDEHGFVE